MNARQAAQRLWPEQVAAEPPNAPPQSRGPSPGQVVDKLMRNARMANQVNTDKDQLQGGKE
jgi:hypothetical protein